MSLARFSIERRMHSLTGLAPLITISGQAQGYINDGTGVSLEMVERWNREYIHKYYSNTHIPIGHRTPFTGGF